MYSLPTLRLSDTFFRLDISSRNPGQLYQGISSCLYACPVYMSFPYVCPLHISPSYVILRLWQFQYVLPCVPPCVPSYVRPCIRLCRFMCPSVLCSVNSCVFIHEFLEVFLRLPLCISLCMSLWVPSRICPLPYLPPYGPPRVYVSSSEYLSSHRFISLHMPLCVFLSVCVSLCAFHISMRARAAGVNFRYNVLISWM